MLRCSLHAAAFSAAASRPRQRGLQPHSSKRELRCSAGADGGAPAAGPPPADRPLDRKVALITGANTGIGYQTAKALLQRDYQVVLACRDRTKAEASRAKLREEVPAGRFVEVAVMDLANLASVRDWAQRAQDFGHPLDVLVLNAGVMACPRAATADGFEYQLGVNHLGHFLLANMLLPLLSTPERPSRVVTVASAAHFFGRIDFADLQSERSYDPWRAYGQSKLANVLFTYELARRLGPADNCTANCLHPGVVDTELARYLLPGGPGQAAWWQKPLLAAGKVFALTPEQGAQTSIHLASSAEAAGVSGKYYDRCRPVSSSRESYDEGVARRLWDVSAELVGL